MQKHLQVFKSLFVNYELVNRIAKFLLAFLIIFIPLYPKFPSIRIPGIYVSVRLEDFIIFFSVGYFVLYIFSNRKILQELVSDKILRSILLFLFIGLVSLISGILLTQTATIPISILHWVRRIEYFSLILITTVYFKKINPSKDIYNFILTILLIVNSLIFFYGMGQRYLQLPVITTQNEEYSKGVALRWVPGSHINSTFAGHYDLASYLVLTLPIFISMLFTTNKLKEKIIFGSSILMGMWLLSVAVSRISIVAFLIAGGVSLFLLKKYKQIIVLFIVSFLIFGFSVDLRARYQRIFDVVKDKLTSIVLVYAQDEKEVFEDRSTSIRLNVEWPRAIRALQKNPLLGTGYSSISLATDNDYLRLLGEVGLLGFSSFLLIFINLFSKFKKFIFTNDLQSIFRASLIGSTIAILFVALFIDIFEASKFATMFWLLMGTII